MIRLFNLFFLLERIKIKQSKILISKQKLLSPKLMNFIIHILRHLSTICSCVIAFLTTDRTEIAIFDNYEIHFNDKCFCFFGLFL